MNIQFYINHNPNPKVSLGPAAATAGHQPATEARLLPFEFMDASCILHFQKARARIHLPLTILLVTVKAALEDK